MGRVEDQGAAPTFLVALKVIPVPPIAELL